MANPSYNTSDLAAELAGQFNFSKAMAQRVVMAVCADIVNALADKKEVRLHQFGVFKNLATSERKGHNPKTGEETIIPAGARAHFVASSVMRDACKNGSKIVVECEEPAKTPAAAPKAKPADGASPIARRPIARPIAQVNEEPASTDVDEL